MTATRTPIVCFGGTFDPVHNGHLAIARAARDALAADVHLLPAADPPHKGARGADAEQRAAMLALALDGERGLRLDRRELRRPGPSWTVDTLRELRAEHGIDAPIAWMIGGDSLAALDTWKEWRALFALAHLIAVERPGTRLDADGLARRAPAVQAEAAGRWRTLAALRAAPAGGLAVLPLSELRPEASTELRRRIRTGEPWREWVPPAVAAYIVRHGLYRSRGGASL
jgi:nicotinate-nucleotide adenylyltransferase